MGRFLGYVRVSRVGDRAETLISPKLQEEAIQKWAAIENTEVEMLPHELDASGGDDTRPILLDAIQRIEQGDADGLVVWKSDRFTRSLLHSLEMLQRIEKDGGLFRSATEDLDPTTPAGRMQRNIMFAVGQNQREVQAESFRAAKMDAIERGIYIAPTVPLGYRKRKDRRLEPDPRTAPVVREVFARRIAGDSYNQLAAFVRDQLNRSFQAASVRNLLKNPAYLGVSRQGTIQNLNAHEALVDRATWEAAQSHQPKPPRGSHDSLLRGHVYCCGCSLRMSTGMGRSAMYYRCKGVSAAGKCPAPASIEANLLDPYVTEIVLDKLDDIGTQAAGRTDTIEEAEARLANAESELAAFQEITSITTDGAEFFQAGMRTRIDAVNAARQNLADQRVTLTAVPDPELISSIWNDLSVPERRQFLGSTIGGVWVAKGRGLGRVAVVTPDQRPDRPSRGGPARPIVTVDIDDLPGKIGPSGSHDR